MLHLLVPLFKPYIVLYVLPSFFHFVTSPTYDSCIREAADSLQLDKEALQARVTELEAAVYTKEQADALLAEAQRVRDSLTGKLGQ